ncbi:MAG: hypothetical protein ACYCO5_04510 [Acidobacteriaceae bacterium]
MTGHLEIGESRFIEAQFPRIDDLVADFWVMKPKVVPPEQVNYFPIADNPLEIQKREQRGPTSDSA